MAKSEEYYINDIKINDWLYEDVTNLRSKIIFANRTEYYLGRELHNEEGAAIQYTDKNGLIQQASDQYYLFGKLYKDEKEWKVNAIKLCRKEKIKDIFEIKTE